MSNMSVMFIMKKNVQNINYLGERKYDTGVGLNLQG
jgi:hypothetical protein